MTENTLVTSLKNAREYASGEVVEPVKVSEVLVESEVLDFSSNGDWEWRRAGRQDSPSVLGHCISKEITIKIADGSEVEYKRSYRLMTKGRMEFYVSDLKIDGKSPESDPVGAILVKALEKQYEEEEGELILNEAILELTEQSEYAGDDPDWDETTGPKEFLQDGSWVDFYQPFELKVSHIKKQLFINDNDVD